jgi:proteasome component ECM29
MEIKVLFLFISYLFSNSNFFKKRQSSCSAISDSLSGRTFDEVGEHLNDLWMSLLKSLDDIKETVREAAKEAVKALENLCIRLCDPLQTPEHSSKALSIVLPILLQHGLTSKAEQVVGMSVQLVHKLAKSAGKALKPHVAELTKLILEAVSSFEPNLLSYMSFHTQSLGISKGIFYILFLFLFI